MVTSAKELQYVTNVGFCADFGGEDSRFLLHLWLSDLMERRFV